MEALPVQFGRYELIDQIAEGGMAAIFRARLASGKLRGAQQILVVKKLRSSAMGHQEFIALFEREAKLAASLSHPNIAKIFDFGKEQGQYFMAMEYLPGKDLRTVFDTTLAQETSLSIEAILYVLIQISKALGYAHSFCDLTSGKHLGIVHRDVSPQNIQLSYSGQVKLLDFGVAKIAAYEETVTGKLKGNPSYMSPEQANGDDLDNRSDLFSVGVVLWELLTGHRLFLDSNVMSTLNNVRMQEIPLPSQVNPRVSKKLEVIVMKALSRDIYARYQVAQELEDDLTNALRAIASRFDSTKIRSLLELLFREEMRAEEEEVSVILNSSQEVLLEEIHRIRPAAQRTGSPAFRAKSLSDTTNPSILLDTKRPPMSGVFQRQAKAGQNLTRRVEVAVVGLLLIGAGLLWVFSPAWRSEKVGHGVAAPAEAKWGLLLFQTDAEDFSVFINGKALPLEEGGVEVPAGQPLHIEVRREGYRTIFLDARVEEQTPLSLPLEFVKAP